MTITYTFQWIHIPWLITAIMTIWHVTGYLFGAYNEWKSLEAMFRVVYWAAVVVPTWVIYFIAMNIHAFLTS